jgi:hypothetical protein
MKSRILLNRRILESIAIIRLFACEDQTFPVGWNAFLVLNLGLNILDSTCWLDFQCDMLASEDFDEDLHCNRMN